jgi:hypothetical protein
VVIDHDVIPMSATIKQFPKAAAYVAKIAKELDPSTEVSWTAYNFICAVELRSCVIKLERTST